MGSRALLSGIAIAAGLSAAACGPLLDGDPADGWGQALADIADEGLGEDEMPDYDGMEASDGDAQAQAAADATLAPAGAPNIVVIVADDMPRGLLGFEGNPRVDTPNIDALKRSGVYFDRFYLPIGQCAPSRTILWTGLFPTRSGVETNGDSLASRSTAVLPQLLQQHGFRTGFFGKCHIGTPDPTDLRDLWRFDSIFHSEGMAKPGSPITRGSTDLWDPRIYQIHNISGAAPGTHFTQLITDKAIEFIEREHAAGQKFFVWLAHRAPHYHTLEDTSDDGGWHNGPPGQIYRREDMPLALNPAKGDDTLADKPPQQAAGPARYFHGYLARRPGGIREHLRRAHEQTRYLDVQVGRLLARLEQLGLRDDTLVVFLSDNGVFFGDRGLCGKGPFNYDEITRVPLVLSWPGRLGAGVERHALAQSTDLSATLLEAATLPKIPGSTSSSFWRVATGERGDQHRRSIFFQYHSQKEVLSRVRGVLKDDLKLSHYLWSRYFAYAPDQGTQADVPLVLYSHETFEMYNLRDDPDELRNLLPYRERQQSELWLQQRNDPARRRQLNDLLRTLAEYQTVADDDVGVDLDGLQVRRESDSAASVSWRSVHSGSGAPLEASAEVVFRQLDCGACPAYEYDYKHAHVDHSVAIDGLTAGRAYEVLVFSITEDGRGGFARYLLPAAAGASGRPGAGNPRLSYIWSSYQTTVRGSSGPRLQPEARCLITGAAGGTIADYQGLRKACIDDCRLRYASNPSRTCAWGGEVFHRP